MGDGQRLLPLTIGHSHGVWGHNANNRRLDFFSAFLLFSTFPCSSGLHSHKQPLSTLSLKLSFQSIVFWIFHVQREPFVPYLQVSRNFYARDEAGIVVLDSLQRHRTILAFNFDRGKHKQAETITLSAMSPHPRLEKKQYQCFQFFVFTVRSMVQPSKFHEQNVAKEVRSHHSEVVRTTFEA